jgi:chemotaxis protein methyltransferase CheR
MTDTEYIFLKKQILKLLKIDLDCYKSQQMRRRLTFFIERTNDSDVYSYCRLLANDSTDLNRLRDFLTINVTEFFRDERAYKELKTNILPDLIQSKRLKIWSAGCSNGGEPYSIAMLLKELSNHCSPDIIATDIDNISLARANKGGPYNTESVKNIPREFISKYFTFTDNNYWINEDVKKMVRFKQHNLLFDKFEEGFDLICCRNVTIYFTQEAKDRLNLQFHNSLDEEGILFIGATEFMINPKAFGFIKLGSCFYKKIKDSVSLNPYREKAVLQRT